MRIEKINNNFNRMNFRGPLELEDFKNSPTLHNFQHLDKTEKLDMIYDKLLKQDEKISGLSRNQQNMQNFNYSGFSLILENLCSNGFNTRETLRQINNNQPIDIIA